MKKTFTILTVVLISGQGIAQRTFEDTVNVKELDGIVITGQYRPQSIKNSTYQVRVITNERIRLSGATQVQQVLSNQLGFRFSSDNTLGTTDVQLMGMSGRNVKILLDGIPMTDRGDTRESLNQVDINTIERIEIVEGPMSVSYGSDALAGVINIITRKEQKKNISVTAKIQDETAGTEYYPLHYKGLHSQHIATSLSSGKWNAVIGGTHNDFDGVGGDRYGRDKHWKPKEQWMGNLKLGYTLDAFSIYYRLDALAETISGKGPINTDTYKAIDKKYATDRYMHQAQGRWHINNDLQVNSLIAYTDYKRKTTTTIHDFEKNTNELTTGEGEQDLSKFNSFIFRTTVQYKLSSLFSFQPGIDITREAASGARIAGSPVITDYAFFISSEIKPTEKINIRPGLRFIKNTVYDAPPVIPSLNTKFTLSNRTDLRLAYAYGFRSPALRELYFDFHDTNHDIIGNPNLEAEFSHSFSGSLNYTLMQKESIRLVSTLGAFYNEFRNLINYALNPAVTNQYITVNIDRFKTTGATLENKLEGKNFNASLGLAYTGRYNRFSEDPAHAGENLPVFTWSPEVNSTIIYTARKIATSFGLFYKYTGTREGYELYFNNTTGNEELMLSKISAFHWADLTITKTLFRYFTATAGVKNIFDITNLRNTSSVPGGIHTAGGPVSMAYGRSYFLGLGFQWSKK